MLYRKWMIAISASVGVLAFGAVGSSAHAQQQITVATWGGLFGKTLEEHFIRPFELATGIKVNTTFGGSAFNKQKIEAERNQPRIDVLTMVVGDAIDAYNKGLIVALDPKKIPNLNGIIDFGVKKDANGNIFGAGLWVTSFGIAYRTDKVDFAINSWNDLANTKLRNKLGLPSPKYQNSYFVWWMNHLGGNHEDSNRGFARIKGLSKNFILEFDASVQAVQKLAQGEIWASPLLDTTANQLIAQGVPIKFIIPVEGGPGGVDVISQVKGGPNPEGAARFINFVLENRQAEAACNALVLRCVVKGAKVSEKNQGRIISDADVARLIAPDETLINHKKSEWLEAWAKEITPLSRR